MNAFPALKSGAACVVGQECFSTICMSISRLQNKGDLTVKLGNSHCCITG
jgi:hypothetical protein